ncbi:MAG: hypothetical protein OXG44_01775 [Gammaproteobacteria bacterium]|nr:hypothetical protein [Gammaproteobacteria bacterium]
MQEAGRGDSDALARRLSALADVPLLPITNAVGSLANELVRETVLPAKALNDALHVAVAAVGMSRPVLELS